MTKERLLVSTGEGMIVPMVVGDIDDICLIEQQITPFPWTRTHFSDSMAAGHRGWVLRDAGEVAGYAIASVVLDEAELLIIGVARERQGQGRGRCLMQRMISALQTTGVKKIFLEVRESNLVAQRLYQHCGFAQTGRRAAYYPAVAGREAALLMTKEL